MLAVLEQCIDRCGQAWDALLAQPIRRNWLPFSLNVRRSRPIDAAGCAPEVGANNLQAALTQEDIRQTREFLERILDYLPLAITVKDARDQRFVMLNRAAEQYWGLSRAEAIGKTVADIFGEERARRVAERDKAALDAEGAVYLGEHRVAKPGEQERTFSARRVAMRDANEKPIYVIGVMEDVTERRQAEDELRRTKAFLDTVVENVPAMLFVKEPNELRYMLINRAGERVLGMTREKIIGKNDHDLLPRADADVAAARERTMLRAREAVDIAHESEIHTPHVGARLLSTKRIVVFDQQDEPQYLLGFAEDITEKKGAEERIEQLAHFDALTGLANRNLFKDRLDEALRRYQQLDAGFGVLLLDLDKFKGVNDSLGHHAGDALLREVATRIKSTIRKRDIAARLGGDEFAILVFPDEHDAAEGAIALASRLITAISAQYHIDGHPVAIGCSIGLALVPKHGTRVDEVLRNADLALYKSKSAGRNCFHVYTAEMKAEADRRSALEIDLREAIWGDQIEVHYQPVVDLSSGRVVSVEALARWIHKSKGPIPPSEFIPVAEEAGLIVELGNLIMLRACRDAMHMPAHVKVAINLSPVQFAKSNAAAAAQFALSDSGLGPERLEFEITEGVLMEETAQNLATLREMREAGISIALDDFGVGYSSLSYLTAFRFNKVKIDKSFVERLDRPEARAVIASIVQLAGSLDLTTVAEGIETEEQLARVRALGIKLGQGFLLSRPVSLTELQFVGDGKFRMRRNNGARSGARHTR